MAYNVELVDLGHCDHNTMALLDHADQRVRDGVRDLLEEIAQTDYELAQYKALFEHASALLRVQGDWERFADDAAALLTGRGLPVDKVFLPHA